MRLILFFLLFTNYLFALISEPIHSSVSSINEDQEHIKIAFIKGAQVGMYGVLVHHFNDEHATALSWVEVTQVDKGIIHAKIVPIHALEQSALPTGTWIPKLGDEVVLGYNYHRALLISPNPSVYKKVTAYHNSRTWIHPDIFTTVLSSNGHPSPLVEDFQSTCRANNIGLLAFVFDKSILTLDCLSFKIMQNKTTTLKTQEVQLPFYTRVPKIEENWFGQGSSKMKEYSPYYIELIAQNNPENEWIQTYKQVQEGKSSEDSWFSWFSNTSDQEETRFDDEDGFVAD